MVGHDNALAMTLREANVLATNDDTITGHQMLGVPRGVPQRKDA
jgi:hypothetical protein